MKSRITLDDRILFLQEVFRALLVGMAHPGDVGKLPVRDQVFLGLGASSLSDASTSIASTLLDSEVGFRVVDGEVDAEASTRYLSMLTYAPQVVVGSCDFLFVTRSCPTTDAKSAINSLPAGTFLDPHKGATVIVECETVSADASGSDDSRGALKVLEVAGPGVDGTRRFVTERTDWFCARQERKNEFPLGLDFIIVDGAASFVCIPRSSSVRDVSSLQDVSSARNAPSLQDAPSESGRG
jgi:alpha-D-ribose 1-methylphosphonate 5-triphosphate synthase subunit PhnH